MTQEEIMLLNKLAIKMRDCATKCKSEDRAKVFHMCAVALEEKIEELTYSKD